MRRNTSCGSEWSGLECVQVFSSSSRFRDGFTVLGDPPNILDIWLDLVAAKNLKGKRVHDAHLVVTLKANEVSHLPTLNASDFAAMVGITILSPVS